MHASADFSPPPWKLESIFRSPGAALLLPTARHTALLGEFVAELPHLRGNILNDVHAAMLMRKHGIREIYTRDTDFHRFPFSKVIDPVAD